MVFPLWNAGSSPVKRSLNLCEPVLTEGQAGPIRTSMSDRCPRWHPARTGTSAKASCEFDSHPFRLRDREEEDYRPALA